MRLSNQNYEDLFHGSDFRQPTLAQRIVEEAGRQWYRDYVARQMTDCTQHARQGGQR